MTPPPVTFFLAAEDAAIAGWCALHPDREPAKFSA